MVGLPDQSPGPCERGIVAGCHHRGASGCQRGRAFSGLGAREGTTCLGRVPQTHGDLWRCFSRTARRYLHHAGIGAKRVRLGHVLQAHFSPNGAKADRLVADVLDSLNIGKMGKLVPTGRCRLQRARGTDI